MHAKIISATHLGINAQLVEVEVDLSFGLINFYIVGLPDTAVKESSKRISSALKNSGFPFPGKRVVVNLAPADVKKEGTLFDLPIALGIILASQILTLSPDFLHETIFLGELSLDGTIRRIKGALPIAFDMYNAGKKRIIVPQENASEAALIQGLEVIGVHHLTELVSYLKNEIRLSPTTTRYAPSCTHEEKNLDFAQVKGQMLAKRALQIAAAGRHNILFIGPPGSGKTMLAQRLSSIMPPMTFEEVLQTSKIYSISGKLETDSLITKRPFRAPHHTISQAGLVGGGSYPQPGEISLAHHGILFLDELTEFKRHTLEVLRQPLEHKEIHLARAQQAITFPCSFLLVAALNPCPCGYWGDKKRVCHCSAQIISKYLEKLSGPLLDRIDLQINIQSITYDDIAENNIPQTSSAQLYEKVVIAQERQRKRFTKPLLYNATMSGDDIDAHCIRTDAAQEILKKAFDVLHLSMRAYHKILKIARTIADLEQADIIDVPHVKEALLYRSLDHSLEKQRT